jgi:hypothetical protein
MKTPIYTATCLLFGLIGPLSAQNFNDDVAVVAAVKSVANLPTAGPLTLREMPPTIKAHAAVMEAPVTYSPQDTSTLEPRLGKNPNVESVVDLSVLQQPSPFRAVATGHLADASDAETNEIKQDLALISATYRVTGKRETNCSNIALSIEQRIKLDHSSALEIVETEVASNPSCACEIVKAAIKATDADTELVVSIIETVISTAPQSMMIATQCAIAAAPESLAGVQALLSKYEANAGDSGYSSKSSKDAKDSKVTNAIMPDTAASMLNPLDFPGEGPIGPSNGIQPAFGPLLPILTRPVTQVSP